MPHHAPPAPTIRLPRGRIAGLAALALAALALGGCGGSTDTEFGRDFTVDIDRYLGLWYETARTPNWFQDNTPDYDGGAGDLSACFNSTAFYTLTPDGDLDVRNRCQRRAPDGTVIEDEATGIATIEDAATGRKLRVAFGSAPVRFLQRVVTLGGGPYWIYCLGPVNADGQYTWSVVSGPGKDLIFVLTRDRSVDPAVLETILACARDEGLPVDALVFAQET